MIDQTTTATPVRAAHVSPTGDDTDEAEDCHIEVKGTGILADHHAARAH